MHAYSLDPDQVPRFVGPDLGSNSKKYNLGSNCFRRHLQIFGVKIFFV